VAEALASPSQSQNGTSEASTVRAERNGGQGTRPLQSPRQQQQQQPLSPRQQQQQLYEAKESSRETGREAMPMPRIHGGGVCMITSPPAPSAAAAAAAASAAHTNPQTTGRTRSPDAIPLPPGAPAAPSAAPVAAPVATPVAAPAATPVAPNAATPMASMQQQPEATRPTEAAAGAVVRAKWRSTMTGTRTERVPGGAARAGPAECWAWFVREAFGVRAGDPRMGLERSEAVHPGSPFNLGAGTGYERGRAVGAREGGREGGRKGGNGESTHPRTRAPKHTHTRTHAHAHTHTHSHDRSVLPLVAVHRLHHAAPGLSLSLPLMPLQVRQPPARDPSAVVHPQIHAQNVCMLERARAKP
jgi:hypothetical protein